MKQAKQKKSTIIVFFSPVSQYSRHHRFCLLGNDIDEISQVFLGWNTGTRNVPQNFCTTFLVLVNQKCTHVPASLSTEKNIINKYFQCPNIHLFSRQVLGPFRAQVLFSSGVNVGANSVRRLLHSCLVFLSFCKGKHTLLQTAMPFAPQGNSLLSKL